MNRGDCQYAYRVTADGSIRCRLLDERKWNFCVKQYMCRVTGRFEINGASDCAVRKKTGV